MKQYLVPASWDQTGKYFVRDVDKLCADRGLQIEIISGEVDAEAFGKSEFRFLSLYKLTNVGRSPITFNVGTADFLSDVSDTIVKGIVSVVSPKGGKKDITLKRGEQGGIKLGIGNTIKGRIDFLRSDLGSSAGG